MNLLDLLKGRKVMVMTELMVPVELEIKEVKENHYTWDIGPSTPENDWWPEQGSRTDYTVYFTNGASKTYDSLHKIEVQ